LRFETKKKSPKNHFLVSISKLKFKVELGGPEEGKIEKRQGVAMRVKNMSKKESTIDSATGYMLAFAVQKHFPFNIYYSLCMYCSLITAVKSFSAVKEKVKRGLPSIQLASWSSSPSTFMRSLFPKSITFPQERRHLN